MHAATKTVSAADIVFRDEPSPPRPARIDMDAVLHDVWRALGESGTSNRNELLVGAMKALITAGVNTKPRLVAAAVSLGFSRGHAGAVLGKSAGDDPNSHLWQMGSNGGLRLHAAAP